MSNNKFLFRFGSKTEHPLPYIMGIVNTTPDSFYDGGEYYLTTKAVEHGIQLLDEGADILDIGGESTRPPGQDYGAGSISIELSEELSRVIPVIEKIINLRPNATISIDTVKPEVAKAALDAGAKIINDVSGGQYDEDIWNVAAQFNAPYILMHGHNPHKRENAHSTIYSDVVRTVYNFLSERIDKARSQGVDHIIADPGIGFAKGAADSMKLIRDLSRFQALEVPLLIGASRKSFIGRHLGGLPPEDRLYGTLAAQGASVLNGARVIRIHDVRPAVEFFRVFQSLANINDSLTEGFSEGETDSLSSKNIIDVNNQIS